MAQELTIVVNATNRASGELKTLRGDLDHSTTALEGMRSKASLIGPVLGGIGFGAAGAAAGALGKETLELDSAMTKFQATAGLTSEEAKTLEGVMIDLGKSHLQSTTEIVATSEALVTLQGVEASNAQQVEDLTGLYLDFATATGQDAAAAVADFDDILDAWGLEAADAERVMDALIVSHQKFGLNVQEAQQHLSTMAPTFQVLGLTIDEAIGYLNLFAASGIDASTTSAAFTRAVSTLTDTSEAGQTRLKNLALMIGLTEEEMANFLALNAEQKFEVLTRAIAEMEDPAKRAELAIELFGTRAGPRMAEALANSGGALEQFQIGVEESAGATEKAANTIESSFHNRLVLLGNEIKGRALDITQDFGPALMAVGELGPKLAGAIGGIVGSFGHLATGVMAASKTIGLALLTPPLGVFVLIATALVAIGIAVYVFRDQIVDAFQTAADFIIKWAPAVAVALAIMFGPAGALVGAALVAYKFRDDIIKAFQDIYDFLEPILEDMAEIVERVWNLIRDLFQTRLDAIIEFFEIWKSIFTGDWEEAWNSLLDFFYNLYLAPLQVAWEFAWGAIKDFWNNEFMAPFRQAFEEAWWALRNFIWNEFITPVTTAWTDFWNGLTNFFNNTILSFFTQFLPQTFRDLRDYIWNEWITPVNQAWDDFWNGWVDFFNNNILSFFTQTLPQAFRDLRDYIWNEWIVPVRDAWSDFWNNDIVGFFTNNILGFITTDIPNAFWSLSNQLGIIGGYIYAAIKWPFEEGSRAQRDALNWMIDQAERAFNAIASGAAYALDRLGDAIETLAGLIGWDVNINVGQPGWVGFPRLARGARGFTGGLAMVGEQGPEMAYIPSGADVFASDQTQTLLRALASGRAIGGIGDIVSGIGNALSGATGAVGDFVRDMLAKGAEWAWDQTVGSFQGPDLPGIFRDMFPAILREVRDAVLEIIRGVMANAKEVVGQAIGQWISPLASYVVSQEFGVRNSIYAAGYHTGIDLATGRGSPIYSVDAGNVVHAGYLGGYGQAVVIAHDPSLRSLYAHMDAIHVGIGQAVGQGQYLGPVGMTGMTTGPHLHLESLVNGVAVNPRNYYAFGGGGIAMGPTMALLGERGREAVIPLDDPRARGMMRRGDGVYIDLRGAVFNGTSRSDVEDGLRDALRQSGQVIVAP